MRWNIDPVLIDLGLIELRWYGLFFATGVLLGARGMPHYYERFKIPAKHAGAMTIWALVAMIVGAHLIHLIFYEPRSFIDRRLSSMATMTAGVLTAHSATLGVPIVMAAEWNARRHTPVTSLSAMSGTTVESPTPTSSTA